MGWSIGYDDNWQRDIGYGVPAWCDHPKCDKRIDRGLAHVCGGVHGQPPGCGLHFCAGHLMIAERGRDREVVQLCPRCYAYRAAPYARPKPDHPEWIKHKLDDPSWQEWRDEHPHETALMRLALGYRDQVDAGAIAATMARLRKDLERRT